MLQENINPALQQEIAEIEKKLVEKKAQLENSKVDEPTSAQQEKEALKEIIKSGPSTGGGSSAVQDDDDNDVSLPLLPSTSAPLYLSPEIKERIQELINEAFATSISEAVGKVRKTKNPALIDAFHDALVDQLYDHLVARGKLKAL